MLTPCARPRPPLPGDADWEPALTLLRARTGLGRRIAEIGLCYRAGLSKKQAARRIGCSECSVAEHTRRLYHHARDLGIINQASFAAFVEWALRDVPRSGDP